MKVIKSFSLDTKDIREAGETRTLSISGDKGAVFTLEIKSGANYYNFQTNLFQTTKTNLSNISITGGAYNVSVRFPSVTVGAQYDIYLFSGIHLDTKHAEYKEVRFADNNIDINASTGSNSNLVRKVLYQTLDVTVTINGYSPNGTVTGANTTSATIETSRGKSTGKIPFTCVFTTTSTRTLSINKQPASGDILTTISPTVVGPVDITGEDTYPAVTETDVVNGDFGASLTNKFVMDTNVADKMIVDDRVTTAVMTDTVDGALPAITGEVRVKLVMDNNVATKMAVGDRITLTGTGHEQLSVDYFNTNIITVGALNPDSDNVKEFSIKEKITAKIPDGATLSFSSKLNREVITVAALNPDTDNVKEFSVKDANGNAINIGIRDNATLSFSNQRNYKWEFSNIDKLTAGMHQVKSTPLFTSLPTITEYLIQTTVFEGESGEYKVDKVRIPALDTLKNPVTTRDDTTKVETTVQTGNVTFDQQALLSFTGDTAVIYAYGTSALERLTGYNVEFSDLAVALTEVSTTTTAAVSASTSVPITQRAGIMDGISSVSGIGIDSSVANPTVASGAGSVIDAGTLVLSAAQTLEDGITLTFPGAGTIATITGNIKINNVGNEDVSLRFDLEKFLTMH